MIIVLGHLTKLKWTKMKDILCVCILFSKYVSKF